MAADLQCGGAVTGVKRAGASKALTNKWQEREIAMALTVCFSDLCTFIRIPNRRNWLRLGGREVKEGRGVSNDIPSVTSPVRQLSTVPMHSFMLKLKLHICLAMDR